MPPAITIIVLNWNDAPNTLDCLHSLQKIDYPNFRVLLVDNGSTDGSPDRIASACPHIEMLRLMPNCGFCGANNAGLRHVLTTAPDYVMLLNNDTLVDPQILQSFVAAAEARPHGGFFGARIYYHAEPTRIWAALTVWDPALRQFRHPGNNTVDNGTRYESVAPIAYASGCAIFCRAALVRNIGMLDTRFFCYFEEVDWCWRAQDRGYTNYFVPAAKLWHKVSVAYGGKQSPIVTYFRVRNWLLWVEKHLRGAMRRRARAEALHEIFSLFSWRALRAQGVPLPRALYWRVQACRRDPMARARFAGLRDYLFRRFGDCPDAIKEASRGDAAVYARVLGRAPPNGV